MPIELLISPPASGKTTVCIRRIRSLIAERPFASVRVVLPDRLQAAAFRRRLAEAGGAIGVQVGTFDDLYRELLDTAHRPIPIASLPMMHRLVQATIEQVYQAGNLQYYAGLRNTPGFALVLRDAFAELKRALVFPEDFLARASPGNPAQQELAHLYLAYQTRLRAMNWADPEGLSWLAVEALQNDPLLAQKLALLVVDGFDSFEGAQRKALELLATVVPEIIITLPGKFPFQRSAHRRFAKAYQALESAIKFTVRKHVQQVFLPADLQHIEASLFEIGAKPGKIGENLCLLEARSPADEAREALRWLKACVFRNDIPLHACAIVAPDPARYHPLLRQASVEFGFPLRFTQGEVLATSPAMSALMVLLNLVVLNYPRRPLLDTLRAPYFDLSVYGLDRRSVDILEEISRYGQVIEGREQWDEVFERLAQSPSTDYYEDDEPGVPRLPRGAQATALHQALNRFFDRLDPGLAAGAASNQPLSTWIRWLEDLLDEWHFYEQNGDENLQNDTRARDQVCFEHFREVLRALVLAESVISLQPVTYNQFVAELQGALEGVGYQVPLPGGQPAALVLRVLEARGLRFQAIAILGLAEGVFPVIEHADPFLGEGLRQQFDLESRLQREQAGLFYQAITRSDRFVLLTRPYLAEDGEKWEPSPYWKAVCALFPGNIVKTIRPDDPRPLSEAASPEEVLFWAVRRHSLPKSFADLIPRWEYLRHAHQVLSARQAQQPAGPYEGITDSLVELLQARYGVNHSWSASRLETYGTCPHQFFVSHALALKARVTPEPGLDAAQLGLILHSILEKTYRSVPLSASTAEILDRLNEIAQQVFAQAPLELGFRPSPLWQVEQLQLTQALQKTVEGIAQHDPQTDWQPLAFEVPFGRVASDLLLIYVNGQTIRLHGLVDRVDRDPDGRVRIIDYKTGSSHLSKPDLILGRRLQLPIYALAAQEALGLGEVVEGFYWCLLKGEAGSLKLSTFKDETGSGPQAAIGVATKHLGRYILGILQAQFPPIPPKGGCPGYCPASTWCWRFSPGWGA